MYREYSGGMMTDWGAHHFDIAQWGLGMDESGPVEIIPPEDPKATRGLRYLYANGVEVVHGPGGGVNSSAATARSPSTAANCRCWPRVVITLQCEPRSARVRLSCRTR